MPDASVAEPNVSQTLTQGLDLTRADGLRNGAAPHVIDPADRLNDPCSASVLDGSDAWFVCRDAIRRILTARCRLPAHCSAGGKTLLACLPPDAAHVG